MQFNTANLKHFVILSIHGVRYYHLLTNFTLTPVYMHAAEHQQLSDVWPQR